MLHISRQLSIYFVLFLFTSATLTIHSGFQATVSLEYLLILLLASFLWRKHYWMKHLLFFTITVAIAIFAHSSNLERTNPKHNFHVGESVSASLYICEEPYQKGNVQYFVACSPGAYDRFRVVLGQNPKYIYAEGILIKGKFTPPREEFETKSPNPLSGQFFYPEVHKNPGLKPQKATEIIFVNLRGRLILFRKSLEENIKTTIPEPAAGLLSGIMLGTRSEINPELYENLVIVGLVHIVALSGFNITIIAESLRIFFAQYSRAVSFYVPVAGIIFFLLATAMSASVVRAAIMGFVLLLGKRLGRRADILNAILLAAVIMVFVNPRVLIFDIGFQLSFAATVGIVYLSPKISELFGFAGKELSEILAATLSAQITTWVIISYYFGRVSIISPIANLLAGPLIPLVMLLGVFVAIFAFISQTIAGVFGFFSWAILEYLILATNRLARMDFASINLKINEPYLLIGYYILIYELIIFTNIKRKNGKKR